MSNQATRRFGPERTRSAWIIGFAAVVAILTMVAPATSARTYTAPYSHYTENAYGLVRQASGCAMDKGSTPTFNGHIGFGTWGGSASASSCKGPLGSTVTSSLGEAAGGAEVAVAVHMPTGSASTTTIAVTWNFSASGAAKLNITRPCPIPALVNGSGTSICDAQAVAMVIGGAWLVDLTNGTVTLAYNNPISVGEYNTSENTTTCNPNCTSGTYAYAGGAAFSGHQSATFYISAITNHADRYAVVAYLAGTVTTEMQGFGGHATGFVNMKSGGNDFQLVSYVVH